MLDALILSTFGVGYQTDAYLTAMTIPLLLTGVFSAQCPRVLIPIFAEYFGRNDQAAAWRLLSNLVTAGFLLFVGISLLGMGLSGVIIPLQIPGFEPNALSLAVWLSRMVFWLVLSQGLASILQSVLLAQQRFVVSSSGKLVTNCL